MLTRVVLGVLLASGAARAEWRKPTLWEVPPVVVADALIVIDTLTTINAIRDQGRIEMNPLLPMRPSTEVLWGACALGVISTTVLWYLLPPPWRSVFVGMVVAGEGVNVARQFRIGLRMTF